MSLVWLVIKIFFLAIAILYGSSWLLDFYVKRNWQTFSKHMKANYSEEKPSTWFLYDLFTFSLPKVEGRFRVQKFNVFIKAYWYYRYFFYSTWIKVHLKHPIEGFLSILTKSTWERLQDKFSNHQIPDPFELKTGFSEIDQLFFVRCSSPNLVHQIFSSDTFRQKLLVAKKQYHSFEIYCKEKEIHNDKNGKVSNWKYLFAMNDLMIDIANIFEKEIKK